jgi:hypothetical protein
MTGLQQWTHLDALVEQLGHPRASPEQCVEALLKLESAVEALPADGSGTEAVEDDRDGARAQVIVDITRLGELPELSGLDACVDPATGERLKILCATPMSKDVESDFVATIEAAAQSAAADAKQLEQLRGDVERSRVYRDLLRDMLSLLDLLSKRDAAAGTGG